MNTEIPEDSIVKAVIESYKQRQEFGYKKYGTNLDREDLSFSEWIQHAQEEMMDATLYLEKMKRYTIVVNHNKDGLTLCPFLKITKNPLFLFSFSYICIYWIFSAFFNYIRHLRF